MKMIFWFSYKILLGNIKRAIFPFLGVTAGVTALIMALAIGAGGEKIISKNLSAIGDNRIMLGGDEMTQRDIKIMEGYPFVEYTIFPEARAMEKNNIFIAYPPKALQTLGMKNLGDREVILDRTQFPNKKPGDRIELILSNGRQSFTVADTYIEENPFELMRQGNRIIVSQSYFEKLFGRYRFKEMTVSFDKNEDVEELLPFLLNKFNSDRRSYGDIRVLETPEVYKRILKIQKLVKNTLGVLAIISIGIGGVGIMTLISSGVRDRISHIGILRAMGMSKENVVKVFLTEGIIISIVGTLTGIILGIIGAILGGKLIMIPPVFNIDKIILAILFSLLTGIGMGIQPARKAGEMNITDALREN